MTIAENRARLLEEIRNIHPQSQLIAVSKQQPEDRINEALACGQRIYGENRVQEAEERWGARKSNYPDLELHLIGPLQTNKVKQAVALFDVIQTLDREKLAQALSKEMKAQNKQLPCLIQVNTGEEPQKSGLLPEDLADFLIFARQECHLNIQGFMCIPPLEEPPALHFAFLKKLATEHGVSKLSMGMSSDYPKALALGTDYVRLGTTFFGKRPFR